MKVYLFFTMSFIAKYTSEHPGAMFWLTNFGYVSLREQHGFSYMFESSNGKRFMVDLHGHAFARASEVSQWEPFTGVLQPSSDCTCWEYAFEEAYLQNLTLPTRGTRREYILKVWKQLADVWFLRRTVKTVKEETQGIKKILKLSKLGGEATAIISQLTVRDTPPTLQSAIEYIYFLQNR